jgi:hypothetical protein
MPRLACSDERIRERTGRGWEEWFDLLDSWRGTSLSHRELARRVAAVLAVDPLAWNAQAVVTSFERARGTRAVGERSGADGFVAGASKTIGVPADDVFAWFVDPVRRTRWLPDIELSERTVSPERRTARYDVGDGTTRVTVSVAAKGPGKATITVEQSRLSGTDERDARRAYWREALSALKATLSS